MKKNVWTVLMGILLIFTSCGNEDDFTSQSLPETAQARSTHFYGVKSVDNQSELRGVAQRDKLWSPGTVITVKLLSDPYNMSSSIKAWASQWEQYANIKFDFVTSGNANVRIGFDWNDSKWITWSYTGTDCKFVTNQNEATLNFAFWDSASELDKKADVLRAFGQVLGLELEHRHLSFDAGWTSRIQQYWEGEIEDIPWAELKQYVFDPIEQRNIEQTKEYDANSIMIWPFDRKYATNTARDFNYELSAQDIEFIKYLYPQAEEQLCFTATQNNFYNNITFSIDLELYKQEDIRIEFADGTSEIRQADNNVITLKYNKTIKVYCNPNNIKKIKQNRVYAYNYQLYYAVISELASCNNLIWFDGDLGNVKSYNFNNYPKLEVLRLSSPYIENVEINKLENLKSFELSSWAQNFNTLIISNPKIEYLMLEIMYLNDLDITKLNQLKNLEIATNSLKSLDLSGNVLLESLRINSGNLENINFLNNLNLNSLIMQNIKGNVNLSNNTKLTFIHCYSVGFLSDIASATQFVNNLPVVSSGLIDHNSRTLESVKSICESKGWTVN